MLDEFRNGMKTSRVLLPLRTQHFWIIFSTELKSSKHEGIIDSIFGLYGNNRDKCFLISSTLAKTAKAKKHQGRSTYLTKPINSAKCVIFKVFRMPFTV